jgi:hypothetical protein
MEPVYRMVNLEFATLARVRRREIVKLTFHSGYEESSGIKKINSA